MRPKVDDYGTSSDEGDDWEEVPTLEEAAAKMAAHSKEIAERIPEKGLVITVPQSGALSKLGLVKKYDPQEEFRLHINRKIKRRQEKLHKAHLVCGVGRIVMINDMLRSEELRGLALSMLVAEPCSNPPAILNRQYLVKVFNWIQRTFYNTLAQEFPFHRVVTAAKDLVEKNFDDNESIGHLETVLKQCFALRSKRLDINRLHRVLVAVLLLRECGFVTRIMNSMQPGPLRPLTSELLKKPVQPKEEVTGDEDDDENVDEKSDDGNQNQPGPSSQCSSKGKGRKKMVESDTTDDDEDEKEEKAVKPKRKKPTKVKPSKKKLTFDKTNHFGCDYWIEVYVPKERLWVSLDVMTGKLENDVELEAKARKPMLYVIGIENDGSIKDVTRRYATRWIFDVVNKRVNSDWWEATLQPYQTGDYARDEREDNLLEIVVRDKSHPENVGDLKNHPFFAAPRFLRKFEAIYPANAQPEGQLKGVQFFSRNFVKQLHSRAQWHREARTVRENETPYKLVKARPKLSRDSSGAWVSTPKEEPLELFGEWQTGPFQPEVAKNGIVPRNSFGNVELFKPEMLPKGTVHLMLPALGKVAKKLGIDCAPALVDFEYTGTATRPVFDGFVVCEEFQEVLSDAWNHEQDENEKRTEQKRRTRGRDNWRKLIRGVLIKMRLDKRYPVDSSSNLSSSVGKPSTSKNVNSKTKPATKRKQGNQQVLANGNCKSPPAKRERKGKK